MAAPIPPMLKYSIVYNLFIFPPIFIKFVSKFIVCKVLYFKAQCLLRLRSRYIDGVLFYIIISYHCRPPVRAMAGLYSVNVPFLYSPIPFISKLNS